MSGGIVDGLAALVESGSVVELRVPDAGRERVLSGYFDDLVKMSEAAVSLSGHHPGVYFTINPVDRALLARASNRVLPYAKLATADHNVIRRRWLPLDLDPVRPPGISSTEGEHQAAVQRARDIRAALRQVGWPTPVAIDSGNGALLLYPLDLPNDDDSRDLVQRVLEELAESFTDQLVSVDPSVFNAARILRVPGTMNAKGDDTEDRPHRLSRVLHAPQRNGAVTRDQLLAIAPPRAVTGTHRVYRVDFDADAFVHDHLDVASVDQGFRGGTRWVLRRCPFHGEGVVGTATAIIRWPSGKLIFKCQHARCSGKVWADVRAMFDPSYSRSNEGPSREAAGVRAKAARSSSDRRLVTVSLADIEPREVPWYWDGWIAKGALSVVTGHVDVGKSWLTYAIAAYRTNGSRLPGDTQDHLPERVLLLGTEDALSFQVRPRLDSLAADVKMVRAVSGIEVDGKPGRFDLSTDLDMLEAELKARKYGLVVISPLNGYLPDVDTHRDANMHAVLDPLAHLAEKYDVAVIAIIHPTKAGQGQLPLYRIQGSVANSAACRTAILVGKDEAGDGEGTSRRHIVLLKNNLMPEEDKPGPLAFTLTKAEGFRWAGASTATKDALLNGPGEAEGSDAKTLIEQAIAALGVVLADGPVEAKAARGEVRVATGASDRTIDVAKVRLGIVAQKVGYSPSRWEWSLPRRTQDSPEGRRAALPASFKEPLRSSGTECPRCGSGSFTFTEEQRRCCTECDAVYGEDRPHE